MVVNISSCFIWNFRGELRFGYSTFSMLFKDEFCTLLFTVCFVSDATKTGSCETSLDQGRNEFSHIFTLLHLHCNVKWIYIF